MARSIERGAAALMAAAIALGGCKRGAGSGPLPIELVSAADTAFTTASGENRIRVRAKVPADWKAATVSWTVELATGDAWKRVTVPNGTETTIPVTSPGGPARLKGKHPTTEALRTKQLEHERIHYRVTATAKQGAETITSKPLEIEQTLVGAMRQEYLDIGLRHGAPPQKWFRPVGKLPKGIGYGDFDVAAADPSFLTRLSKLETTWKADYRLQWQLNSFYRNPTHNRFHIDEGGGSGPVSNSWHQFGCAADLQTYPLLGGGRPRADTLRAREFWNAMAQEALELGFEVEPRDKNPNRPGSSYSGVGHVHVEKDCIP